MEPVIQLEHLYKSYGGVPALQDLNLTVQRGEIFGLLGPNGAGKSTAVECALGTRQPDKGQSRILGLSPTAQRKELFQQVGVQFQEAYYPEKIRVGELCEMTASLYKAAAPCAPLLAQFGLKGKEKQMVGDLSGGQKQALFIVLALLPMPRVVFLDELTTGLDTSARRAVWHHLATLKEQGLTIFLTSHFMDEVEALCDRVCVLQKGRQVFTGTVQQALAQTACGKMEDAYLCLAGETQEGQNESI